MPREKTGNEDESGGFLRRGDTRTIILGGLSAVVGSALIALGAKVIRWATHLSIATAVGVMLGLVFVVLVTLTVLAERGVEKAARETAAIIADSSHRIYGLEEQVKKLSGDDWEPPPRRREGDWKRAGLSDRESQGDAE